MAETLKVLGQVSPAATTLMPLYTVPALTSATVSTISVCNGNSSSITFRVSVAIAGAADDIKQYIFRDVTLTRNNTLTATLGMTLGAADVVKVYASATNVSFNLFGVEVT